MERVSSHLGSTLAAPPAQGRELGEKGVWEPGGRGSGEGDSPQGSVTTLSVDFSPRAIPRAPQSVLLPPPHGVGQKREV